MRMTRYWFLLFVLSLAACGNSALQPTASPAATTSAAPEMKPADTPVPQQTPTSTYFPVFETADCRFEHNIDADIQCGYLIVPENRSRPERMIRLHVAIIPSSSTNPEPDPVVFLSGGPGAYALVAADYYAARFDKILDRRDLILLDQRGVGFSEPALDCPEVMANKLAYIEADLEPTLEMDNYLSTIATCHERLTAASIDLSAYNSASSAADLDDLRHALGYESWNLLGVSYGTRLALTAARDFGDTGTIRSVILDSAYPPQIDAWLTSSSNLNNAFEKLFARCGANEACNKAFPDMRSRFYELVDKLNEDPSNVFVTDRQTRTIYEEPFNGYDLIDTLFQMMYDANQITKLPRFLARLEQDRKLDLSEWLTNRLRQPDYFSEGMSYSVQCAEEIPFNDFADLEQSLNTLPPQLAEFVRINANHTADICELWQVETADAIENQPVVSEIPTLILSGDYDPITPPSYAQETAAYLDHAYSYELVGLSHGVVMSNDCAMELVVGFLSQPYEPPDDSCLDDLYVGFAN